MSLGKFVIDHTERGECKCGRCADAGATPDPSGHTADLVFFKVAMRDPVTAQEFIDLTTSHRGEFGDCDPLDGREHGYMELGGWIGDQGLAMCYMGLGTILGVFDLLTPKTVLGLDGPLALDMAQGGLLSVKRKRMQQTPSA